MKRWGTVIVLQFLLFCAGYAFTPFIAYIGEGGAPLKRTEGVTKTAPPGTLVMIERYNGDRVAVRYDRRLTWLRFAQVIIPYEYGIKMVSGYLSGRYDKKGNFDINAGELQLTPPMLHFLISYGVDKARMEEAEVEAWMGVVFKEAVLSDIFRACGWYRRVMGKGIAPLNAFEVLNRTNLKTTVISEGFDSGELPDGWRMRRRVWDFSGNTALLNGDSISNVEDGYPNYRGGYLLYRQGAEDITNFALTLRFKAHKVGGFNPHGLSTDFAHIFVLFGVGDDLNIPNNLTFECYAFGFWLNDPLNRERHNGYYFLRNTLKKEEVFVSKKLETKINPYGWNTLAVSKMNGRVIVWINDIRILDIIDKTPIIHGGIGIGGIWEACAEFDDIKLTIIH